ncbi:MAG: hypothetical protein ACI9LO_002905 [Planctomycetota bacterium]
MKFFIKLLVVALVIAVLLPFTVMKGKDGGTLLNFSDLKLPDFSLPEIPELPAVMNEGASGKSARVDVFYQWYDDEGNIQFTTSPPAVGIDYTVKEVNPDANLIQSVEMPKQSSEQSTQVQTTGKAQSGNDLPNPYSKESVERLFKDAENVEKLLQQRMDQQKSVLDQ